MVEISDIQDIDADTTSTDELKRTAAKYASGPGKWNAASVNLS
jgi:hypothetical protein